MGAKTWMLVYADGDVRTLLKAAPALNRIESKKLARRLFSNETLEELPDGSLSYTCPPDDEICVGCFAGVSIVAAKEFAIDYPSSLPIAFRKLADQGTLYLHAMHSVVDWLAFAVWKDGVLVRSLSLSPDSGILENVGRIWPSKSHIGQVSNQPSQITKKTVIHSPSTLWNLARRR